MIALLSKSFHRTVRLRLLNPLRINRYCFITDFRLSKVLPSLILLVTILMVYTISYYYLRNCVLKLKLNYCRIIKQARILIKGINLISNLQQKSPRIVFSFRTPWRYHIRVKFDKQRRLLDVIDKFDFKF